MPRLDDILRRTNPQKPVSPYDAPKDLPARPDPIPEPSEEYKFTTRNGDFSITYNPKYVHQLNGRRFETVPFTFREGWVQEPDDHLVVARFSFIAFTRERREMRALMEALGHTLEPPKYQVGIGFDWELLEGTTPFYPEYGFVNHLSRVSFTNYLMDLKDKGPKEIYHHF